MLQLAQRCCALEDVAVDVCSHDASVAGKANPSCSVTAILQAAAAELEAEQALRFSAEQATLHLHASLSEVSAALQASEVRV